MTFIILLYKGKILIFFSKAVRSLHIQILNELVNDFMFSIIQISIQHSLNHNSCFSCHIKAQNINTKILR